MEHAYLLFRLPLFDWSLKRQHTNLKKVYAVDTGLSSVVSFNVGRNEGYRLENSVFLELMRRGHEIYYYKTKGNLEVDFVVKEDEKIIQLIQEAAEIRDEKTKAREANSLFKAASEIVHAEKAELLLLVPDIDEVYQVENRKIIIKDLKSWLLGF